MGKVLGFILFAWILAGFFYIQNASRLQTAISPVIIGFRPKPNADVSRDRFRTLVANALQMLPRREDGAVDSGVLSYEALELSRSLNEIASAVASNPALQRDALMFYQQCAATDDIILAVRGKCLFQYKRLAQKFGATFNPAAYPVSVVRLSEPNQ
jgi:hypothetical protein